MLTTLPVTPDTEHLSKLFACIAPLGHFIQIGLPDRKDMITQNPSDYVMKQISVHGSLCGSRKETEDMLAFSAKHDIKVICKHFSFADFPKALEKLEKGKPRFRCIVDVQPVSAQYIKPVNK